MNHGPTQSVRADKNAATMRALLDAAAQTFAERGFETATMDEIAARVGLTKGALYYRFRSKEDLFLALLDDRCAAYIARFREHLGDKPSSLRDPAAVASHLTSAMGTTWPRLFLEFVSYSQRNAKPRRELRSRMGRLRTALATTIEESAEAAGMQLPVDPSLVALGVIVLASGWSVERLADPRAVSEELLAQLLGFLFEGIATHAVAGHSPGSLRAP